MHDDDAVTWLRAGDRIECDQHGDAFGVDFHDSRLDADGCVALDVGDQSDRFRTDSIEGVAAAGGSDHVGVGRVDEIDDVADRLDRRQLVRQDVDTRPLHRCRITAAGLGCDVVAELLASPVVGRDGS